MPIKYLKLQTEKENQKLKVMNHHWPNWARKLLSYFFKYPIQRKWDCFYYWRGKLLTKYKLTEMGIYEHI